MLLEIPRQSIDTQNEKDAPDNEFSEIINQDACSVSEVGRQFEVFLKNHQVDPLQIFMTQYLFKEVVSNEMIHGYELGRPALGTKSGWSTESHGYETIEFNAKIEKIADNLQVIMTFSAKGKVVPKEVLERFFKEPEHFKVKLTPQPTYNPNKVFASHFIFDSKKEVMNPNEEESGRGIGSISNIVDQLEIVFLSNQSIDEYPGIDINEPIDHEIILKIPLKPEGE